MEPAPLPSSPRSSGSDPAEEEKFPELVSARPSYTVLLSEEDLRPKAGVSIPMMRRAPEFIYSPEPLEPILIPKETIIEDSLRREPERVAHQENLLNKLVYDSINASPFNPSAAELPDGTLPPYYVQQAESDTTLVFESRFECGNLRRALQIYEFEYDLILSPDYNTKGNTQWYYFSISNTRANRLYRFNIINMMKPDSLYNYGMRPLMYSTLEAVRQRKGWARCGQEVCYYQNPIKRRSASGCFYTLTFAVVLPHDNDVVYFAHCYPYTYTDLSAYLNHIAADPAKRNRVRRSVICQTIAGNNIDLLTITTFNNDKESLKKRKGVVLMSRVHPGETNASWLMKGLIDFLLGPALDAKVLRDNFIIKVVPMLNPDGVINGSYRCGLAGVDLNRCWVDPNKKLNPSIFHTKAMIKRFTEEREVVLCCDIHGHSRKKNVFMYGCPSRIRLRERVFPRLLEKSADIFSFSDCVFGLQKAKEATARIVLFKELGILNSYTLEASFCGSDFGKYADCHFNTEHYQEIARHYCDALLDFCNPDQTVVKAVLSELEQLIPREEEEESDSASADSDFSNDDKGKKPKKKKSGKKKAKESTTERRKKAS